MNEKEKLRRRRFDEWCKLRDGLDEINESFGRSIHPSLGRKIERHPEYSTLKTIDWEGMITVRWEAGLPSCDSEFGAQAREEFTRLLISNLSRKKWGYRGRNKIPLWVVAEEFGKTDSPHHHILISFERAIQRGLKVPDLSCIKEDLIESAAFIEGYLELPLDSVDVDWQVGDYAPYVCKVEEGRNEKLFLYGDDVGKMFCVEEMGNGGVAL